MNRRDDILFTLNVLTLLITLHIKLLDLFILTTRQAILRGPSTKFLECFNILFSVQLAALSNRNDIIV